MIRDGAPADLSTSLTDQGVRPVIAPAGPAVVGSCDGETASVPDIEVVPWRNLNVLAVQVYPSNTRPHYLQRMGPEDGVFIRVSSTNRKAEVLHIEE